MQTNKRYEEKCEATMARMPDNYCDLIMTSPPYGNARVTEYESIHPDKYIEWLRPIAKEWLRVLKPTGSLILNVGDNTVNGETHLYTFEIPILLKRELGFHFIDPFIWHKKTTPPGRYNHRFKDAWEFCFHFSKSMDIKFRPDNVKVPVKQQSIQRALRHKEGQETLSQTGSGFTSAAQNMQRRLRQNTSSGGVKTVDARLDQLEMALPSNVLYLSSETTNVGHPAAYPVKLPHFFIQSFTDEGDIVYDPFGGSGTTDLVCMRTGRQWISSEPKPEYNEVYKHRTKNHSNTIFH